MALKPSDVWADTIEEQEVVFIFVEKSKVDQLRTGHTIVLPVGGPLCPKVWLRAFWAIRPSAGEKALFCDSKGIRLSKKHPYRLIKRWLPLVGVDPAQYGSHSCRKGGVTAAANVASHPVSVHVLKRHGNWRSDAIFVYLEDSLSSKLTVGLALQQAAAMACPSGP
jgi:hypothetical protein